MELVLLVMYGTPPLHFACSQPCTWWLVFRKCTLEKLAALLLSASVPADDEEWRRFHHGMLPLHCACRARAEVDMMIWLGEKYPDALRTCTTDTMDTPLHCYLSSSTTTTTTVLHTTTSETNWHNNDDDLPTSHRSSSSSSSSPPLLQLLPEFSLSTIEYLVQQNPVATHQTNRSGWLPLHLAAMHDAPIDILFYLTRHYPESLLRGGN